MYYHPFKVFCSLPRSIRIFVLIVFVTILFIATNDRFLDNDSVVPFKKLRKSYLVSNISWFPTFGKSLNFFFRESQLDDMNLTGYIWPTPGSLDNRILNQIKFIEEYAKIRGNNITTKKMKVVLRVGNFNFNDLHWMDGQQRLINHHCPITDCFFTSDGSNASKADALVISQFGRGDLPRYTPKPRHQIWIAQHLESPHHNRLDPTLLNRLVNWTASFRPESTIQVPYATWVPVSECGKSVKCHASMADESNLTKEVNYAKNKTKMVAWFVSNCADRNGRLNYARELAKYIQVDIYGGCGDKSCPRNEQACPTHLKKDYKFYLSFENSHCVGYITEKFHWNALSNNVIPIVFGARQEDYAAVAPVPPGGKSYIHVDDFENPKHLADYLKVLNNSDTLYNEYFTFRKHFRIVDIHDTKYWCRLCAFLHFIDDVKYVHWYEDYGKWWNGACSSRQDGSKPWRTWRPEGYWNNITNTTYGRTLT